MTANNDPDYQLRLGRAYRDGKGVPKDLDEAAKHLRMAHDFNISDASVELFDLLWEINTDKSYREMIEIAYKYDYNRNMQGRLGRAYRDGKGVPKDLNEAAKWMRKAYENGLSWASWELFDILLKLKTESSVREMMYIGVKGAKHNIKELQGRIARQFRDGKLIQKSTYKAMQWMRKAYENGLSWASWELYDILYKIDNESYRKERLDLLFKEANLNNREMQGRLGRAYRDGKGVPKDLNEAAKWMRKAYENGLSWASWEFFDISWTNNCANDQNLKGITVHNVGGRDANYFNNSFFNHKYAGLQDAIDYYGCASLISIDMKIEYEITMAILEDVNLEQVINKCKKLIISNKYSASNLLVQIDNKAFALLITSPSANKTSQLFDRLLKMLCIDGDATKRICTSLYDTLSKYSIVGFDRYVSSNTVSNCINAVLKYSKNNDILSVNQCYELFLSFKPIDKYRKTIHLNEKLLSLFDTFCLENDIKYFIAAGTLIGYLRHGEAIPWDDDVDVFMFREDMELLKEKIKGNKYIKYCQYERIFNDYHFVITYRIQFNIDVPFFVDIFTLDYSDNDSSILSELNEIRNQMLIESAEIITSSQRSNIEPSCPEIAGALIDKYVKAIIEKYCHTDNVKNAILGIDNFSNRFLFIKTTDIFPLKRAKFGAIDVYVPYNPIGVIEYYGDIMTFPSNAYDCAHHTKYTYDDINKFEDRVYKLLLNPDFAT